MLFAKISHEAIESIGSARQLAVYVALMRFARFRDGGSTYTNGVWVSDTKLATMLGLDVDTVASCKESLRIDGWIDWEIVDDKTQYIINFSKQEIGF